MKRAVLTPPMAFCAAVSASLVTRTVAVTRNRAGDAVALSNTPAIVRVPFAGSSETLPGTVPGEAHAGSGSGPVGVGATGQNSTVAIGFGCSTNPVGSASESAPSKTAVPAGTVTA